MRRVLSALVLAAALAVALSASAGAAGSAENEPAPSTSSESGAVPEEPCPIDENGNCLSDRDRDGVSDTMDNCPDHWNPGQEDNDGDGFGNVCDPTPNGDGGGGGGGGGGPPPGTNCDGGEGVYIYQHFDYQGGCYKLTGDSGHASYWSTVGNDAASSVGIVGGWSVVLYTEAWYSGGSVPLSTSSPNPWAWGGGWSWNDTISSARVYRDADHDGHADGADNCPDYYSTDNRCDADPYDDIDETAISATATSVAAGGQACKWIRVARLKRNVFTVVLWKYHLKVYWCWNADVITNVDVRVWPEILVACCWR